MLRIEAKEREQANKVVIKKDPPTAEKLLELVNKERAKVNVPALKLEQSLNKSAQLKADDMLKRNYFGHEDPDGKRGTTYIFEQLPSCRRGGENITDNVVEAANSNSQIMSNWINSKLHYDAMVSDKYTITGFGIAGTKTVQHFC